MTLADPAAPGHRPRTPGIAVVIPCYNYARFVGAAIESVLAQSTPYAQVIVVNDGSTDDSLEVIERYAEHVEIITQENAGLLGACLTGIAAVRCEYVHVLDADDVALPTLVERCTPLLASRPVKVQFQLAGIDPDGQPNGSVFPSYVPGYDRVSMMTDNRIIGLYQCPPTSGNVWCVATLRGLDLEAEDPRLPLDGAGNAVMPYLGEVLSLPEPLAGYRVHGASMSMAQVLPTPEQAVRDIADFEANWESAARIMGHEAPPYGASTPLFLLERRLIRDGLTDHRPQPLRLVRYLMRLAQSNLPMWQRVVQGVWMASLQVPSRTARTRLVHLRRSGSVRPAWLRSLLRLVRT